MRKPHTRTDVPNDGRACTQMTINSKFAVIYTRKAAEGIKHCNWAILYFSQILESEKILFLVCVRFLQSLSTQFSNYCRRNHIRSKIECLYCRRMCLCTAPPYNRCMRMRERSSHPKLSMSVGLPRLSPPSTHTEPRILKESKKKQQKKNIWTKKNLEKRTPWWLPWKIELLFTKSVLNRAWFDHNKISGKW